MAMWPVGIFRCGAAGWGDHVVADPALPCRHLYCLERGGAVYPGSINRLISQKTLYLQQGEPEHRNASSRCGGPLIFA